MLVGANVTDGAELIVGAALGGAGALAPLAGLLTVGDAKIVNVALKAMEKAREKAPMLDAAYCSSSRPRARR